MGAAAPELPRSRAEEDLIADAAARLDEHDAHDLAWALRASRLRLHPYSNGRRRHLAAVPQFEATVTAPPRALRLLKQGPGEGDRLLRAQLAAALQPLRVVRSVEVVPDRG